MRKDKSVPSSLPTRFFSLNSLAVTETVTMTMKKRLPPSSSPSIRQYFWLGLQLVLCLSVLVCVLAVLRINSQSPSSASSAFSPSGRSSSVEGTPKIAFLFLARSNLPLDFLWHAFFQVSLVYIYKIILYMLYVIYGQYNHRSPIFLNNFSFVLGFKWMVGWCSAECQEAQVLDLHTFRAGFRLRRVDHEIPLLLWPSAKGERQGLPPTLFLMRLRPPILVILTRRACLWYGAGWVGRVEYGWRGALVACNCTSGSCEPTLCFNLWQVPGFHHPLVSWCYIALDVHSFIFCAMLCEKF